MGICRISNKNKWFCVLENRIHNSCTSCGVTGNLGGLEKGKHHLMAASWKTPQLSGCREDDAKEEDEDSFRDYDLVLSASATRGLLGAKWACVFASSQGQQQGDLHSGLISSSLITNSNSIRYPS